MTVQVHVFLRFLLVLRWQYYEVLDVDSPVNQQGPTNGTVFATTAFGNG